MNENIYTALHSVYSQVGYVQKKGRNQAQNYRYASEADLIEAIRPAMIEAGIVFFCADIRDVETREVRRQTRNGESLMLNTSATFTFRFTHAPSGTSIDVMSRGEGSDSLDKAAYKAQTGALKYALRQSFVIETGDDPDRDEAPKPRTDVLTKPAPASYPAPASSSHEAPTEPAILIEARKALAAIPKMDAERLAKLRSWLQQRPEGQDANRWKLITSLSKELSDQIGEATTKRVAELESQSASTSHYDPPPSRHEGEAPRRRGTPEEETEAALAEQERRHAAPAPSIVSDAEGLLLNVKQTREAKDVISAWRWLHETGESGKKHFHELGEISKAGQVIRGELQRAIADKADELGIDLKNAA